MNNLVYTYVFSWEFGKDYKVQAINSTSCKNILYLLCISNVYINESCSSNIQLRDKERSIKSHTNSYGNGGITADNEKIKQATDTNNNDPLLNKENLATNLLNNINGLSTALIWRVPAAVHG